MRKHLVYAVALTGMSTIARADDALSMYGFTLYGVVDLGVAYQTHGAPLNDYLPQGLEYLISKSSNRRIISMAPNGLGQSRIGLTGKREFADGWSAVLKLETGFNPTSGELSDALKSMAQNNGVPLANQSSSADSARAGQAFQGSAFVGISSNILGTATFGRHTLLLADDIARYDPQAGSYAFSVIGYSGVTAGGGDTQDTRLDSSVKYTRRFGWMNLGGLYQSGTSGSPGSAYEFDLGADSDHASIDLLYTHKNNAISAAPLTAAQAAGAPARALAATVSDNTAYSVMGRYTVGALKTYAGYEYVRFANPSSPPQAGMDTIGGYTLSVVNSKAYTHHRFLQIAWTGLRYSFTPAVDVVGAYYRYSQNSYQGNGCRDNSAPQCSGTLNAASVVLDYRFRKHFDAYAGSMWSMVADGLAAGYLHNSTVSSMAGLRFSF